MKNVDIFQRKREPISMHLLRCSAFVVENHSFMRAPCICIKLSS
jgi:hypothetical protein